MKLTTKPMVFISAPFRSAAMRLCSRSPAPQQQRQCPGKPARPAAIDPHAQRRHPAPSAQSPTTPPRPESRSNSRLFFSAPAPAPIALLLRAHLADHALRRRGKFGRSGSGMFLHLQQPPHQIRFQLRLQRAGRLLPFLALPELPLHGLLQFSEIRPAHGIARRYRNLAGRTSPESRDRSPRYSSGLPRGSNVMTPGTSAVTKSMCFGSRPNQPFSASALIRAHLLFEKNLGRQPDLEFHAAISCRRPPRPRRSCTAPAREDSRIRRSESARSRRARPPASPVCPACPVNCSVTKNGCVRKRSRRRARCTVCGPRAKAPPCRAWR